MCLSLQGSDGCLVHSLELRALWRKSEYFCHQAKQKGYNETSGKDISSVLKGQTQPRLQRGGRKDCMSLREIPFSETGREEKRIVKDELDSTKTSIRLVGAVI